MKNKTISDKSTRKIGDENTDQLAVKENDNINNEDLLRITYRVINFLIGASYNTDKFGEFFRFEKQASQDKAIMLNSEQILFCLKEGLKEEVSVGLIEQILESGFTNGLFRKRTNDAGELPTYVFVRPGEPVTSSI